MFYTWVWSILRMFYTWDFMQKETSVTNKMLILWYPPYMNETYRFWWNLLNCYPEKARITISLTLYQTVRHKQVQIKYGFFIHPDNFSFAQRVQWLFIDDLTFEGHFMLTYCNSLKCIEIIEIHWFSDKLNTSYEVNWGQIQNEPFHTTTNTASNHLTVGVRVLG